jgi:hypothetical protein
MLDTNGTRPSERREDQHSSATSSSAQKTIVFRSEALQYYLRRHDTPIFPRLIAPQTFALSWVAVLLLGVGIIAILATPVTTYVSGFAFFPKGYESQNVLMIVLAGNDLSKIQAGQSLLIQSQIGKTPIRTSIARVETHWTDARSIQRRFNLPDRLVDTIDQPIAVITIQQSSGQALAETSCKEELCPIKIGAETRRIGSILLTQ